MNLPVIPGSKEFGASTGTDRRSLMLAGLAGRPPEPVPENNDLFDYALIRDYLGFALRSPMRHKVLAFTTVSALVSLSLLALWALPKTYEAETRILAQRNPVMSTLANPYYGRPFEADAPTRAARETVLRWDNLVSLVEQTDLANRYLAARAPIVRFRDSVHRLLTGREMGHDDLVEMLAHTLAKKLKVEVGEGLVTIGVEWQDAEVAYRLVEAALQNFLEARHASEVSIVGEAISILEGHTAKVQREVDATTRRVEDLERASRGRPVVQRTPATRMAPQAPRDEGLASRQVMLATKQRALADLEDFRQRRVTDLQAQLAQQRAIYADRHPAVVSTLQSIDALSRSSPQIEALRAEAAELEREIIRRGGRPMATPSETAPPPQVTIFEAQQRRDPDEDPRLEGARGDLRFLVAKLSSLADRIDSARMEMDTVRAAFKYRYTVIVPPQMPKSPSKPNANLVLVASIFGGLLLTPLVTVAADLRSGRIVESWQIQRKLGIPVLAKIGR